MLHLVLISGISGSGKTVALRMLEDTGYACVDNLPVQLLPHFITLMRQAGQQRVAVAVDARSIGLLDDMPEILARERNEATDIRVLFLDASDTTLIQRFSETRRRHPLSNRLHAATTDARSDLEQTLHLERECLQPLRERAHVIDTSNLSPSRLRLWVRTLVEAQPAPYTLTFESFAFKHGVPLDADFVFDVRCLPNPYYDPALRPLTGCDAPVISFLKQSGEVLDLLDDIQRYLERWVPRLVRDARAYVTVALGCTGGQHRSVYCAEQLGAYFQGRAGPEDPGTVLVRHRQLDARGAAGKTVAFPAEPEVTASR